MKSTRRDFLKGGLAAAGAAALIPRRTHAAIHAGAAIPHPFVAPWGVTFDGAGNLYVTDAGAYEILVFDAQNRLVRRFGKPGSGANRLNYPTGLAFWRDRLFICDTNNGRLAVYRASGEPLGLGGGLGITTAKLAMPNGVFATDRWLWVANTRGHCLQRYETATLRLDRAFGALGDDETLPAAGALNHRLRLPTAVTGDGVRVVYLLDSKHARVLALDEDGRLLWERKPEWSGLGLSRPQGLTFHRDWLIVADTGNDRLLKLDLQGNAVNALTGMAGPHGVAVFGERLAIAQLQKKTVHVASLF